MSTMVRKSKTFLALALATVIAFSDILAVQASNVTADAAVEQVVEVEAVTEVETVAESETETVVETKSEEETTTVATTAVETGTEEETTTVVETEVETTTEVETETEVETTTVVETETEVETTTVVETETEEITEEAVALAAEVEDENQKTYAVSDLKAVVTWGAQTKQNEDGSVTFTFPEQYNQLSFAIPEEIDKTRLEKIVCNTNDNASYLSLKIFRLDEISEASEAQVVYGNSQIVVKDELTVNDIKCLGIMGLEAEYAITIDSITFVYGEEGRNEAPVVAEDKTYKFSELEKTQSWNVEISETENGNTLFDFTKQWGAVSYKIPEDVNKEKLGSIVCKVRTSSQYLSVKIFSDEGMQQEEAVVYGASTITTDNVSAEDINCFGLMGTAEEGCKVEIESVTFVMKEETPEASIVEKPFYKSAANNNPIVTQRYSADPGVMVYNDTVYVFATNDVYEYKNGQLVENTYATINTLNCFSSKDMVNWTDHGAIPVAGKDGIAKWAKNSWAPAAAHKVIDGKDKFFLYFADNGGGIGVLTADSPTGPWTDPLGHGFITRSTPNCSNVDWLFDPAVFVDDDGTGYLYFGGGGVEKNPANPKTARVVKLGDDMISLANDPVMIDAPYLFEDSGINKIGDKYYYSYCTNWNTSGSTEFNNASIAYMVSDNPMGPFEYVGEMFKNPGVFFGVWGNNHHSLFEFKGKYYLAYHARALEKGKLETNLGYRSTQIDEVKVEDGVILLETPTLTGVPQLEKVNPYVTVQAETMARELGIEVVGVGDTYVKAQTGDWTSLKGVDFEYGVADITMAVKADKATKIEIRTGSPTGTLIGTVNVEPTGDSFKEVTTAVQNVSGEKSLFFIYGGDVAVDYWKASTANIFTFDQLEAVAEHSLTKEVTSEGALKVSYEKQWGEVRFVVPECVDITRLNKLVVKVKSGDVKNLSLKLLSDYSFETQDNLLAATYENSELSTSDVANRADIKYFGIMSKADGATEFEFESVVFEMDADKADDAEQEGGIQWTVPDLKDAIAEKTDDKFITGLAIMNSELSDKNLMDLVKKHANAVTFGNELKPDCLFGYSNNQCPGTNTITFNGVEMEVPKMDYSRPEKMLKVIKEWNDANPDDQIKVRGHVLVWHSQTPEWFFHEDYDANKPYVDKDTMNLRLEWYIKTVFEHFTGEDSEYKGMFYGWDVVNEAVSDGRGTYRNGDENSSWWRVYNSNEFIINAFRYANKYAPADVELYYNDYNEWVTSKVGGIAQLLKDVKNAEGTRIDGMGMQSHYATAGSPSMTEFKNAARTYAQIVDKIQITELDMKASSEYDGTTKTQDAEYTKQAYRYKELFDAVLELRAEGINLNNITIWGVIDKNSWLQTSNSVGGAADGRQKQCPLLYDDNYQVKPAYWAFVDDTKLEPQIKSLDIIYAVDDEFTSGKAIELGGEAAKLTATPVWNEEGISVLAKVKDATVDATDAVTVYVSVNKKITKVTVTRAEATATADGYEAIIDVPCDVDALRVAAEMKVDFVLTNGNTQQAFNDYTLKHDSSDKYFAVATLKPYIAIQKGTATVDGIMEDAWKDAVDVPLTINLGSKTEATAKLLWDADYLYAYIDVTDAVLNSDSGNAHEKDSVEVFIDENNHKSDSYEEDDKQYRINYLDEHSFSGTKCLEENLKSKVVLTDKGYVVEAKFAWTDVEPKAGMTIGLELQINDADASGKRIGTLSWYDVSGQGWSKPGVFGTAVLVGGEDVVVPSKPSTGNTSSDNTSSNTTPAATTKPTVKIEEEIVALAGKIMEETENAVNVVLSAKKAVLRQTLLSKYHGKKQMVMAHLGNGVGFSLTADALGNKDVNVSTTLTNEKNFAKGFDSFKISAQQKTTLASEVGMHVHVGTQHVGKIAYIFQRNLVTGEYELCHTMQVNAIGNVGVMTDKITDMYVLIQE